MRKLIYEAVVLLGVLVLLLGLAIPWIISNPHLPLWLDGLLFLGCLIGWVELARPVIKRLKKRMEALNGQDRRT